MESRFAWHFMASMACACMVGACGGGDSVQVIDRSLTERVLIVGDGAPADEQGQNNDLYLDAQAHMLYGPRSNGKWPLPPISLVGPAGANGQDGSDGRDGSQILSGNGPPVGALGMDGDFYLDVAIRHLYGPKTAGTWPSSGIALIGPAGAQGPAGPQGPAGSAPYSIQWNIGHNTSFGAGTYFVNPSGINNTLRYPVLLPRACLQARLQVATFGSPTAGNSFAFTVLHTPGPDLSSANTAAVGGLVCTITDTVRSCDVEANVSLQEGAAIEVQLVGTQSMESMVPQGGWAIGFTCQ